MKTTKRPASLRSVASWFLVLMVASPFLCVGADLFSPPFLRRTSYLSRRQQAVSAAGSLDAPNSDAVSSFDESSGFLMGSSNPGDLNMAELNLTDAFENPPPPVIVNRVSSTDVKIQNIPSISDINREISMQHQQVPVATRRTVSRPQLRSLDNRPSQPVDSEVARRASEVARRPSQPGGAYNRRPTHNRRSAPNRRPTSRNGQKVSEGHRLITRALWRIFDALMEKNEKDELKERMNFVENALKEMISYNGKLEDVIDMIKEENLGQDERLDELMHGLTEVKGLSRRVEDLNGWRRSIEGAQNDAGNLYPSHPAAAAVNPPVSYTSCPPHFENLHGECFLLGEEPKLTWGDARRECSKYGADLAAPKDLDALREFLQNQAYLPEYVWVGASRQGNGDWVWSAGPDGGKKVTMTTYTWNDNLPSGLGNCMGLYEGSGYRAYDYKCEELDLYVCQFFLGDL